ncbi:MAG TPA: hypothetical protein VN046_10265, partial [Stenotrophobium sp.]|nr:hypothetical protein [Stenotrophobium sp.]
LSYYQDGRKALYAVDEAGNYTTVASSGWKIEEQVTSDAANEYRRLAEAALLRARAGQSAALEYHMYAQRMDVPMLAETARTWQWRVRRHLRPRVFARLSNAWLRRYGEALGLSVEQLKSLPA